MTEPVPLLIRLPLVLRSIQVRTFIRTQVRSPQVYPTHPVGHQHHRFLRKFVHIPRLGHGKRQRTTADEGGPQQSWQTHLWNQPWKLNRKQSRKKLPERFSTTRSLSFLPRGAEDDLGRLLTKSSPSFLPRRVEDDQRRTCANKMQKVSIVHSIFPYIVHVSQLTPPVLSTYPTCGVSWE